MAGIVGSPSQSSTNHDQNGTQEHNNSDANLKHNGEQNGQNSQTSKPGLLDQNNHFNKHDSSNQNKNSNNHNSNNQNSNNQNNNQNYTQYNPNYEESHQSTSKRLKIDEEHHSVNNNLQTLQPANVKLEHFVGQSSSSGTSSAYVSPNNNFGFHNPYGVYAIVTKTF